MKLGIVGLPNVGKSTLFNATTNSGSETPISFADNDHVLYSASLQPTAQILETDQQLRIPPLPRERNDHKLTTCLP